MKMILITYNEAIDEEVTETLEASEIRHFTKWTKVLGSGHSGGMRLNTHIWPGANNALALVVADDKARDVMAVPVLAVVNNEDLHHNP